MGSDYTERTLWIQPGTPHATTMPPQPPVQFAPTVTLRALTALPTIEDGDDLPACIATALRRGRLRLRNEDILVVASKVVSRAEGRFVDLTTVEPTSEARSLAAETGLDPRLVELTLRESVSISRKAPGVLVTRHRLGHVSANACIDRSNARPADAAPGSGPWVLLLPHDPDASARKIRSSLEQAHGARIGVIVSDSLGRPFRVCSLGPAIGVAGVPAVADLRGTADIFGRTLEQTVAATADAIAAAADLVAGQAAERRAVTLVRGVRFAPSSDTANNTLRPAAGDLYA